MAQIDAPDGINVRFWLGPDNFRIADHSSGTEMTLQRDLHPPSCMKKISRTKLLSVV